VQVYTVHRPPIAARNAEPLLLREGFNCAAALFTVFWALSHRLWWTALGLLVAAAALQVGLDALGADEATALAFMPGYMAIVGFFANDWRRAALDRDGWRFDGVIAASGMDAALRRYADLGGGGDAASAAWPG
jgi:uncharacterized membrane protein YeiB